RPDEGVRPGTGKRTDCIKWFAGSTVSGVFRYQYGYWYCDQWPGLSDYRRSVDYGTANQGDQRFITAGSSRCRDFPAGTGGHPCARRRCQPAETDDCLVCIIDCGTGRPGRIPVYTGGINDQAGTYYQNIP